MLAKTLEIRPLMRRQHSIHRSALAAGACCAAALLLFSAACRKKVHVASAPNAPAPTRSRTPGKTTLAMPLGYAEEGVASWYGVPFHGRPAADGEIYDMEKLVAAHRLMPFNTWIKVTNLANGKAVNVRVIDRGPFVEGRILDLSKAAARQIDLLGPGTGRVRIEVISAPPDVPANDFYAVQVGAFSQLANAQRLRDHYAERFGNAQLAVKQGATPLWRVLVGKEPSIQSAQELAKVIGAEDKNIFVVRLDQTHDVGSHPPAISPPAPPSSNPEP